MNRTTKPDPAPIQDRDTWIFDLDNTLYPASCNLFGLIDVRMREFLANFLKQPPEEAFAIQKRYFREFGTTLKGMMLNHDMPPEPFLDYVHDIPLDVVPEHPELAEALAALPGRKVIFTNASRGHAERVMDKLGITEQFEAIFDIVDAGYTPKPHPETYDSLIERFTINPERSVMVEDIARNLKPARDLGMATVWVRTDSDFGRDGLDGDHIDHVVDDLATWLRGVIDSPAG